MFNRTYIFKGSIFHCYVSLPECKWKTTYQIAQCRKRKKHVHIALRSTKDETVVITKLNIYQIHFFKNKNTPTLHIAQRCFTKGMTRTHWQLVTFLWKKPNQNSGGNALHRIGLQPLSAWSFRAAWGLETNSKQTFPQTLVIVVIYNGKKHLQDLFQLQRMVAIRSSETEGPTRTQCQPTTHKVITLDIPKNLLHLREKTSPKDGRIVGKVLKT